MDALPIPETRDDRELLLGEAERALIVLAVSEPSGQLSARRDLLERATRFVAYLRTRLLPTTPETLH